jgi:starvation-inducible DNA-binding protein
LVVATRKLTTQAQASEVASNLQPVLTDLLALTLNLKQAHWHVRGRHFIPVHELIDAIVDDARTYSDDVAERVVALGVAVDGRPETVADKTSLPHIAEGFLTDDKVVAAVLEQLDAAVETARATLDPLDKADQVSQDIVIELLRALEKHRWMFAAQTAS